MEWIAQIANGSNFIPIAVFTIVLIGVLAFLAKRGVFSVSVGGVNVGHTEKDVRALLMKMLAYCKQYNSNAKQELIARQREKGYEMDYMNTTAVFERVFDDVVEWLLVNHISSDKKYIEEKTEQIKMTVATTIGKLNQTLRLDNRFMADMYDFCEEYTKGIIFGMVSIRENFKSSR